MISVLSTELTRYVPSSEAIEDPETIQRSPILIPSSKKSLVVLDKFIVPVFKAIFELVYSSGLRVSEVQCLNLEKSRKCMGWIDFDQEMVIVFGKGSRWRKVPLGKVALRAINEWIKFRIPPLFD